MIEAEVTYLDFRNGIDIVLVTNLMLTISKSNHASLYAHSLQLRTTKLVSAARQFLPVDALIHSHLS